MSGHYIMCHGKMVIMVSALTGMMNICKETYVENAYLPVMDWKPFPRIRSMIYFGDRSHSLRLRMTSCWKMTSLDGVSLQGRANTVERRSKKL